LTGSTDRDDNGSMRLLLIALGLVGCYNPAPQAGAPCDNGVCPQGLKCIADVCVLDGSGEDGGPGGDTIVVDAACGTCSPDGTMFVPCQGAPIACSLGCSASGGDHCSKIVPSNDIDPSSTFMTSAITITGSVTFHTDSGEITGALTRPAGSGVSNGIRFTAISGIGVFGFDSLTIENGGTVHFADDNAVALIAEGAIVVNGTIDGSGGCYGTQRDCAGPGGGVGASMGVTTGSCGGHDGMHSTSNADDGGGGGGGGGESGRSGGDASVSTTGGSGGSGCISASLVPLVGGGGGGAGGPGTSDFPLGGGGGGAIQLVSQTEIRIGGLIKVAGAGGDGGNTGGGNNATAGSGGGGGGGVLLEAPAVTLTGTIAANGGAGGGGGNSGVGPGADGEDGTSSTTTAKGGMGVASPGPGNGGDGGAGGTSPTSGGNGTNSGGGGGGRGVIRINSQSSPSLDGTLSPSPTTGQPVVQ